VIYGQPRFEGLFHQPIIYHGVFGLGFFQTIYPAPISMLAAYLSSIEWVALTGVIFALSIPLPILRIVPYLMFGGTFLVGLSYMINARLEPRFDTILARLLVAFLAIAQPLVRGYARYFTWMKFKRTPESVIDEPEKDFTPTRTGGVSRLNFWSDEGHGRERLLHEIVHSLETEGWSYSTDTGWKNWDIQIYGSFWWIIRLRTVTEYYGGPRCLTRVALLNRMVATTTLLNLFLLGIIAYRGFVLGGPDWFLVVPYLAFLGVLWHRLSRLKKRVAALVEAAASRSGLHRVTKKVDP